MIKMNIDYLLPKITSIIIFYTILLYSIFYRKIKLTYIRFERQVVLGIYEVGIKLLGHCNYFSQDEIADHLHYHLHYCVFIHNSVFTLLCIHIHECIYTVVYTMYMFTRDF